MRKLVKEYSGKLDGSFKKYSIGKWSDLLFSGKLIKIEQIWFGWDGSHYKVNDNVTVSLIHSIKLFNNTNNLYSEGIEIEIKEGDGLGANSYLFNPLIWLKKHE